MANQQCSFDDAIAATREWEQYRDNWIASLLAAKQTKPSIEQIASIRDIWMEGFLSGRLSK